MNPKDQASLDRLLKQFSPEEIHRRWRRVFHVSPAKKRLLVDMFFLREEMDLFLLAILAAELPAAERLSLGEKVSAALKEVAADSIFKEAFGKILKQFEHDSAIKSVIGP